MTQPSAWDIGTVIAVGGLLLAFLRAWHVRERKFEKLDEHLQESEPLIQRFLELEGEYKLFAQKLDALRVRVEEIREDAKLERDLILRAIADMNKDLRSDVERLRAAVYEGERRRTPRG